MPKKTKKGEDGKIKIIFNNEQVNATEVHFKVIDEPWLEIKCDDGSEIKIRPSVVKIMRLDKWDHLTGEPVYLVQSNNQIQTHVPQKLRELSTGAKAPDGKEIA